MMTALDLTTAKRLWATHISIPMKTFVENRIHRKQMDRMYLVFGGHIFFQTLRTGVQIGLFSLLEKDGPSTRAELARRLNIEEQPLRLVLLGLTATGLLRKRGDRYVNAPLARELLVQDSPRKITAYVELQHRVMYKGLYWMLDAVREYKNVGLKEFSGDEPTLYQRLAHEPELERVFQEAMQELSVQANTDMVKSVDLSSVRHLVDVGGGDGTNLIALAKRWPHLYGTVFDSPTVCEIAKKNIAAHGLSDRLSTAPGDCFQDPFPKHADGLMFCHFFTIWGEKKDRALLQKCRESLPAKGKAIIFNMMQHDDETGPLSAAVGSPYFLTIATGIGMLYTWSEYESWMRDAGFQSIRRHKLPRDHGLMIGTKP